MFFTAVECPGKSMKIIFMKGKWLTVVTAVNGFTECVKESQILCFAKKNSKCYCLYYHCSSEIAKAICTYITCDLT